MPALQLHELVVCSLVLISTASLESFSLRFFFAAALPFARRSFAAFMSLGIEVRMCLVCVGTSSLDDFPGSNDIQAAAVVGIASNIVENIVKPGVSIYPPR